MNETHDPEDEFDDEFDQMLQGSLEQTHKAIEERDRQVYDGVVGEPPRWVPKWAVTSFKSYRNRLLDVRGYTHEDLLTLIEQYRKEYYKEEYREDYIDDTEVSNFKYPATYPSGQNVDPLCFHDEIGFLSWLKWCADQEPEVGLKLLGGGFAASGLKAVDSQKAALNGKHAPFRESKDFCINTAREIWSKQVSEKDEIYRTSEMALLLFRKLISKGLRQPTDVTKVAEWLRDSATSGELDIPPEARKSGRPKKNPSATS